MTHPRWFLAWTAVVAAVVVQGCSTAPRAVGGYLIVAGGATRADNELVYERFMAPLPPDAVVGVIPTASANTAESAAASAKTLARYAGSRRIITIDMSVAKPELASDVATVEQLKECSGLWFTGGVQSRIISVFRPPSGDTPAYTAAADLLARGGVIGGTSAGAAMMSDPMINGGTSEDALLGKFRADGGESGFGFGKGMGFFPYGLTDQHFLRRGRLGRLVVALERAGIPRGFGVEEDSALAVDLQTHTITVIGRAVLVDVSRKKLQGAARTGVRLCLLNTGDTIDGRTGATTPKARTFRPGPAPPSSNETPGAWSAGAIAWALEQLAGSPEIVLQSPAFSLRLQKDAATSIVGEGQAISVVNARLDIVPRTIP